MNVVRGMIVQAEVELNEPKLYVVVSNNRRNGSRVGSVLTVRLTTTPRPDRRRSIVDIPHDEIVTGRALCDEIGPIYEDEVLTVRGALSPRTMRLIDQGLAAALSLTLA